MTEKIRLITKAKIGVLLLVCVFVVQSPPQLVYAGEINSEEARLLQLIQQTFTYEGKTYQVSDNYLEMTRSYLMQDDVDFTSSQVDQLLSQIKSNVATGVTDGYLYEVVPDGEEPNDLEENEKDDSGLATPVEESQEKEIKEDKTNVDSQEEESTKDSTPEPTKEPAKEPAKEPTKEPTKEPAKEPTKVPTIVPTKVPVNDSLSNDDNSKNDEVPVQELNAQGTNDNRAASGIEESKALPGVIKDTGFSISVAIVVGVSFLILYLLGLTIAYRISKFANNDE